MVKRRWILIGAALAVLAVAAVAVVRARAQSDASQALQTTSVTRGTVVEAIDSGGTIELPLVATLVWESSGTAAAVHVVVGQSVRAGEVLVELDADTLEAAVVQAQADLLAAQQALDEALAGPTAQELAAAEMRLAQARQALHDARYTRIIQQQGNRASDDTIASARAGVVVAEGAVARAQADYDHLGGSPDDDPAKAAALIRLVEARSRLNSAQRTLSWYLGGPSEIQQALLDAEVAAAEAEVEAAERALSELEGGPDPLAVAAARARLASAAAIAARARLTAPFVGTVVDLHTAPGDRVSSGTLGAAVADLSRYRVEVSVSEIDVARVAVGQEATLVVDALPGVTLRGRVTAVSFLGTVAQGVVTYPVTVTLDEPDPALRPGMTAAVSLIVERREAVLIVPNRAIQTSAGQRIVRVLFEGRLIEVPVTLGLVGSTTSEILDGALQEGDVVALSATSSTASGMMGGAGGAGFIMGGFGR